MLELAHKTLPVCNSTAISSMPACRLAGLGRAPVPSLPITVAIRYQHVQLSTLIICPWHCCATNCCHLYKGLPPVCQSADPRLRPMHLIAYLQQPGSLYVEAADGCVQVICYMAVWQQEHKNPSYCTACAAAGWGLRYTD